MIRFSSQLIDSGKVTQINLNPQLMYTSDEAISKFDPVDRNCYADGEANLTYLPYHLGFRYEMNNCLIDQAIRDIIWNCRCIPVYGLGALDPGGKSIYDAGYYDMPRCQGAKLHCANARSKSMGPMGPIAAEDNIFVPEALKNPDVIGNISKPRAIKCLPACRNQFNKFDMSHAKFPQFDIFFYQKLFCDVASHIWLMTCQDEDRAYFLRKKQPLLCPMLSNFNDFFGQSAVIKNIVSIGSREGYTQLGTYLIV